MTNTEDIDPLGEIVDARHYMSALLQGFHVLFKGYIDMQPGGTGNQTTNPSICVHNNRWVGTQLKRKN